MKQVFYNLTRNALEAMGVGGILRITGENSGDGAIQYETKNGVGGVWASPLQVDQVPPDDVDGLQFWLTHDDPRIAGVVMLENSGYERARFDDLPVERDTFVSFSDLEAALRRRRRPPCRTASSHRRHRAVAPASNAFPRLCGSATASAAAASPKGRTVLRIVSRAASPPRRAFAAATGSWRSAVSTA